MYQILLVDDEYVSYQLIFSTYDIFKSGEFTITGYTDNGASALEMIKNETYDLIISDIRMPVMNGLEFLQALRDSHPNMPVILASTSTEFNHALEGLRLNAFDYVEKPFTASKMTHILNKIKPLLAQNRKQADPFDFDTLPNLSDKTFLFLKNCQNIIQNELANPFLMDELAEQLSLSKKYLSRNFKTITGQNLLDYITFKRLNLAAELLTTTHLKIYEISEQVGYQTVDYFSQKFKAHFHLTPKQYRDN